MSLAEWILDDAQVVTEADIRGRLRLRVGVDELWIGKFDDAIFLVPSLELAISIIESPMVPPRDVRFEFVGDAPVFVRLRRNCSADVSHLGQRLEYANSAQLLRDFARTSHEALSRFDLGNVHKLSQRYLAVSTSGLNK